MFNSKKINDLGQRVAELEKTLSGVLSNFDKHVTNLITESNTTKLAQEQAALDDRQNSSIPFVEIISDDYDPERGVQLQLDWNDAFVKELKSKGYTGHTDRDIVNKWLVVMHQQLAEQFDKTDRV